MVDPCLCEPLEIPDEEVIARAIYQQQHLRADRSVKWQAFQPKRGKKDLSIMRTSCMTCDECKAKAHEIETDQPLKQYAGFLFLKTGAVRVGEVKVFDSREEFCGHGHIALPLQALQPPAENGVPTNPAVTAFQREMGDLLLGLSRVCMDPSPREPLWPEGTPWLPTIA